jgi:hypothetical protein
MIRSRWSIAALGVGLLLVLALAATLAFGGGTETEDERIGEPLDERIKSQLRSTRLGFIADTGRIITHPSGSKEIIWDPPKLPTLEESIRMFDEAVKKNDNGLIPLCTEGFSAYLKAYEKTRWPDLDPYFPACRAIPSGIYQGPSRENRFKDIEFKSDQLSSSRSEHTGYYYQGTEVSEGINGAISVTHPSVDPDEWVAARFLAVRNWNDEQYWLEGGWAVYPEAFDDYEPHVYTQQCNSTGRQPCEWYNFDAWCGDDNNALVYVASQADGRWDSHCWDFSMNRWRTMWHDADLGDDDAHRLEAYLEVSTDQPGTIPVGSVRFYALELRDSRSWHDWDTTYSDDTGYLQQDGYTIVTNSRYDDFYVTD